MTKRGIAADEGFEKEEGAEEGWRRDDGEKNDKKIITRLQVAVCGRLRNER